MKYMHTYRLDQVSTGDALVEEQTTSSALVWQRKQIKKLINDKRRSPEFRQTIEHDTIVAWLDFDQLVADGCCEKELDERSRQVFAKMDYAPFAEGYEK